MSERRARCTYSDLLICPHCGKADSNSWEIPCADGEETTCGHCEKAFIYSTRIERYFTSRPTEGWRKDE
jgi:hypothetical protein